MRKKLFLLFFFCVFYLFNIYGKPTQQSEEPIPQSTPVTFINPRTSDFDFDISIYHSAQTSGTDQLMNKRKYFHKPLLAFKEIGTALTEFPKIVHDVETDDKQTNLTFKIVLSNEKFRGLCKDEIIKIDGEWIRTNRFEPNEVIILKWPIKSIYVRIIDSINNRVYGEKLEENLADIGDEIEITIPVLNENISLLKNRFNRNKIKFDFWTGYSNKIEEVGTAWATVTSSTFKAVETYLESKSLKVNGPVFQDQRKKLSEKIRTEISSSISAGGPSVISLLGVNIPNEILTPPAEFSLADLEKDDPALKELTKYLTPILQTMETNYKETTKREETEQKTKTKGVTVSIPAYPGVNISEQDIHTLKNEYGTEFTKKDTNDYYEPHKVTISKFISGWQDSLKSFTKRIYLGGGYSSSLIPCRKVFCTFTESKIPERMFGLPETRAFNVPLGTMLPYFGAGSVPPPGFVWADGNATWPKAEWVPEDLKDKRVPDMRQYFVGGAPEDPASKIQPSLGLLWTEGKITLPSLQESDKTKPLQDFTDHYIITAIPTNRVLVAGTHIPAYNDGWTSTPESWTFEKASYSKMTTPNSSWREYSQPAPFSVSNTSNPPYWQARWIIRVE